MTRADLAALEVGAKVANTRTGRMFVKVRQGGERFYVSRFRVRTAGATGAFVELVAGREQGGERSLEPRYLEPVVNRG